MFQTFNEIKVQIAQNQIDEKRFLSDYDRMKQNGAATVRKVSAKTN